jgi:AraC family transcriptional activator of pobA
VMTMRARSLEFGPEVVPDDRAHALVLHYRDLIEAHFREERRIAYYADLLAVTPARLNTVCQSRLGTTASGLLHNRIVAEAKRCLICTSMSVAEIGYALGFEDPAYFSRFFSKRVGVAPGRLREVLGAEPAGTS